MAGKGKRSLNAADLKAMDRGRIITVIPPGGRAELRVSKSGPSHARTSKDGRRPCNP
jgi:hypothetical protein